MSAGRASGKVFAESARGLLTRSMIVKCGPQMSAKIAGKIPQENSAGSVREQTPREVSVETVRRKVFVGKCAREESTDSVHG